MWERNLIILLHNYSLALWNNRNKLLHGETKKDNKKMEKQRLQEQVKNLYNKTREYLTPMEKKYFNMPVTNRQKQGIYAMKVWCEMAEDIFKNQEIRRKEKKNQLVATNNKRVDQVKRKNKYQAGKT